MASTVLVPRQENRSHYGDLAKKKTGHEPRNSDNIVVVRIIIIVNTRRIALAPSLMYHTCEEDEDNDYRGSQPSCLREVSSRSSTPGKSAHRVASARRPGIFRNVTCSARPRAANEEPRLAHGRGHGRSAHGPLKGVQPEASSWQVFGECQRPEGCQRRAFQDRNDALQTLHYALQEAGDKEAMEAEEAQGLPRPPPSKDVGTDTRLLATKREPTILGLRKKKASARYKRSQLSRKEWRGASPTHQGAGVDPSAPASTVPSGVSSSRKEGSLFEEKGQDFHTAAQDSKQTATESDRVRSSYAGSLPGTWASWRKRLGVAVACVTIAALVAVAGLVAFFWPRHRTKEAALARANRSDSTKQSKGPVKQEIPVVQLIATNGVEILGLLHRLLH
ncbi:hypothetical protein HPB51_006836 [Rhipicephalus microplus]|uniref:Transmembrane protein n=1 Tax=Rhipicephalus microplus TaxID=6941 RepID=A0A9J6E857_RHIMP|nr:hypothetical protein HPB51_006836 [Rhipicephalus microplus]